MQRSGMSPQIRSGRHGSSAVTFLVIWPRFGWIRERIRVKKLTSCRRSQCFRNCLPRDHAIILSSELTAYTLLDSHKI